MKKFLTALAGLTFATMASPASATVINFDNLGNGVVVTSQYAGVTFSSQAGSQVLTSAQSLGSSLPNFICSAKVGSGINCVDDVYVDFLGGVSGLSFKAVGANNVGNMGDVRVFAGATLLGTVNMVGSGTPLTPVFVNLAAFANVTRIEIANVTDAAGLGYDDFTFDQAGAVPEASTWAMMIAGFGLVGVAARRRSRKLVIA